MNQALIEKSERILTKTFGKPRGAKRGSKQRVLWKQLIPVANHNRIEQEMKVSVAHVVEGVHGGIHNQGIFVADVAHVNLPAEQRLDVYIETARSGWDNFAQIARPGKHSSG